jgi:hypothetical protein
VIKRSDSKKNLAVIVLAVILGLSLVGNIIQYCVYTAGSQQSIVGTYETGVNNEFPSEDDETIIFVDDGSYMRYKQFQIFEEGTYQVGADNIVELVSQDKTTHAVWQGKKLFYFESDNGSYLFEKVSNTPMKTNV